MPTNEYLLFATSGGANVVSQATWSGLPARGTGFQSGLAASNQLNKAWRQATMGSVALATMMAALTGNDVLDDGNVATFVATLQAAIRAASAGMPVGTVTGAATTYTAAQAGTMVVRTNGNVADNTMVDTLPGTGPGILAANSVVAVNNGDTASLLVIQAGAGAVLKDTATGFVVIGPGQSAEFISDGANYWPLSVPSRSRLRATTTMYVSTTGNNGNHGFLPGAPFATLDAAYSLGQSILDLNSNAVRFQLANGSYSGGLNAAQGGFVGQVGPTSVVINGSATPANVVMAVVNNDAFLAGPGTSFFVQGLTIQSTGTAKGIHSADGGFAQFGNIAFGAMTGGAAHVYSEGGTISAVAPYSITGGSGAHLFANGSGAKVTVLGNTISIAGTPAFSNAFANCLLGAEIFANGAVYSGATTGKRYASSYGGNISTGGGGASFFPGNVAGTADAATFANYS